MPTPDDVPAMIGQLQKDSDELPRLFLDLANKIDYKKWSCDASIRDKNRGLVDNFTTEVANIELNADTLRAMGEPNIVELAEVSYDFGRGLQLATLLASTTSACTNQKELTGQLNKLADRFMSAWDNAHIIEMGFIEADEEQIHDLKQQIAPKPPKKNEIPIGPGRPQSAQGGYHG